MEGHTEFEIRHKVGVAQEALAHWLQTPEGSACFSTRREEQVTKSGQPPTLDLNSIIQLRHSNVTMCVPGILCLLEAMDGSGPEMSFVFP